MYHILVTGGAGFIGSHTVDLLMNNDDIEEVIVIDNLYAGRIDNIRRHFNNDRFKFLNLDISDLNVLREKLGIYDDIDAIIHLAAIVGVDEAYKYPWRTVMTNVIGTLNILEYARLRDIERIVYASSAAVYGDPEYLPIDEEHPLKPLSLYGETKLVGEILLWRYMNDYGLKPVALRYFNVYGPRMRPGPYSGVIYKFVMKLLKRETPVIYGDGEQTRDFIYVEDVAQANILAMQSNYCGALNIGSGEQVTINQLYRLICRIIGYCPEPIHDKPRPGDIRHSVARIDKAIEKLGWRPKTSLREGLEKTIKYYKEYLD